MVFPNSQPALTWRTIPWLTLPSQQQSSYCLHRFNLKMCDVICASGGKIKQLVVSSSNDLLRWIMHIIVSGHKRSVLKIDFFSIGYRITCYVNPFCLCLVIQNSSSNRVAASLLITKTLINNEALVLVLCNFAILIRCRNQNQKNW